MLPGRAKAAIARPAWALSVLLLVLLGAGAARACTLFALADSGTPEWTRTITLDAAAFSENAPAP